MDNERESETFNPAAKMDGVSERQAEEIKSQSRPNAALIHETIRPEGESELERRWWAILLSGLAAGLSISLSLIVQGELHAFIADVAVRRLVAPLGYSVGFLVVVMGRQQLFTENTLAPILPLLHHLDRGILECPAALGACFNLQRGRHVDRGFCSGAHRYIRASLSGTPSSKSAGPRSPATSRPRFFAESSPDG